VAICFVQHVSRAALTSITLVDATKEKAPTATSGRRFPAKYRLL